MNLHTAGDLPNWHPHIHTLIPTGAFDSNDEFHPFELTSTNWLTSRFAENLFVLLELEPTIEIEVIENIKQWTHSGFNVWVGEPVNYYQTDELKFLARYLRKSTINQTKLKFLDSTQKIRITKQFDDKQTHKDFTPLEFLAELSQ